MALSSWHAECGERVNARIHALTGGLPGVLGSVVRDLAGRRGKSVRPLLLTACGRLGTPDPARLDRLGAVVELLHLASLLHDDIVDRASVRRGGPAAHVVIGQELATVAGLACFAVAGQEAAELGTAVGQLVGRTVAALSYGEILDLERAFDVSLRVADYLELTERKTADLFRLSCLLGAAEGQSEADVTEAIGHFGRHLGIAFQVLDDCLDLNPGEESKPAGTDHMLGLFGAPTLYALARDDDGQLADMLLSPAFTAADIAAVRVQVAERGGLKAAASLARQEYQLALAALDCVPAGPGRDRLVEVAGLAWREPQ